MPPPQRKEEVVQVVHSAGVFATWHAHRIKQSNPQALFLSEEKQLLQGAVTREAGIEGASGGHVPTASSALVFFGQVSQGLSCSTHLLLLKCNVATQTASILSANHLASAAGVPILLGCSSISSSRKR